MNNRNRIKKVKELEDRLSDTMPKGWLIVHHNVRSPDGNLSVWKIDEWDSGEDIESVQLSSKGELIKAHENRTRQDIKQAQQILAEWLDKE